MWTPDEWQPVWAALVARVPTLDPSVAPAWYAGLQRWKPAEVIAAIQQMGAPRAGQSRWRQLMAILNPPPPPVVPALDEAIRYAREAQTTRGLVAEGDQPAGGPRVHPAVADAAAMIGLGWLAAAEQERAEHRVKWAQIYMDVLRRRREAQMETTAAEEPGRPRPV